MTTCDGATGNCVDNAAPKPDVVPGRRATRLGQQSNAVFVGPTKATPNHDHAQTCLSRNDLIIHYSTLYRQDRLVQTLRSISRAGYRYCTSVVDARYKYDVTLSKMLIFAERYHAVLCNTEPQQRLVIHRRSNSNSQHNIFCGTIPRQVA